MIVWVSDNGGPPHTGSSNEPLRGRKGQAFEGGIRVPGAVYWPGKVEGGGVVSQQIFVYDWLPTLAAATGVKLDGHKPLDGENVWPQIAGGETFARRDKVVGTNAFYAVFRDRWKLVQVPGWDGMKRLLFDVEADPNETTDLAAKRPELVRELAGLLKDYPTVDPRIAEGRRRADGSGAVRDPMERYTEETLPPVAEAAR